MNTSVDNYFIEGCGRCELYKTDECKVHRWAAELNLLRNLILETDIVEESKWGVPCYTYNSKNVLILSAFKAYCSLSFLKGSLLADQKKILVKPGRHTQAARILKFTSISEIALLKEDIRAYIFEAIEIEKTSIKPQLEKNPEPLPSELLLKFEADPVFKNAFEALSPGRQRGYIIHFSQAKQPKTRTARIEKYESMILKGVGMHDHYKSKK
ncbi:MAG: YdeI/OmpD-associated family protein [Bacteroidia bacterium]